MQFLLFPIKKMADAFKHLPYHTYYSFLMIPPPGSVLLFRHSFTKDQIPALLS